MHTVELCSAITAISKIFGKGRQRTAYPKKILWANIASAWLPMPEQRELYLHTETENQIFVFNIFLVLTHSACPYKNCGIKYFVDP